MVFEFVSQAGQVQYHRDLTRYVTVFGTPDIWTYPDFTGLLPGVIKVLPGISKLLEKGF